jgi:septation ring formation regulator EzrA
MLEKKKLRLKKMSKAWDKFEDFISYIDERYNLKDDEWKMVGEIEESICDLEKQIEELEYELDVAKDDEDTYSRNGVSRGDF